MALRVDGPSDGHSLTVSDNPQTIETVNISTFARQQACTNLMLIATALIIKADYRQVVRRDPSDMHHATC